MEIGEAIKTAWAAVEESGVPDQVQELAFKEALRSLLGTALQSGPPSLRPTRVTPPPAALEGRGDAAIDEPQEVTEEDVLQKVSNETEIPIEKLEQVFHVDNGVVKLIGAHARYGPTTSDQARTVAQIVTVVRKLGMGMPDTSFEVIKDACETKHCYDSKNFASQHMPRIDGFVVKGERKNRRLEAKGGGISAFPALIDKVLGQS